MKYTPYLVFSYQNHRPRPRIHSFMYVYRVFNRDILYNLVTIQTIQLRVCRKLTKKIPRKKKYFSSTSVSLMLIDETHFRSFFLPGDAFLFYFYCFPSHCLLYRFVFLLIIFIFFLPSLLIPLILFYYFYLFPVCVERSFLHKIYIFYFITDPLMYTQSMIKLL